MKITKRKFMPTSLEKRFMAIFLLGAALSWAAFRYLHLIPALAVLLVGCLVVWRLLHRYLIKPIQELIKCRGRISHYRLHGGDIGQ